MNRYMEGAVFEDGKNSRAGVKPKEIKRKCTENEEHIIQKMPKWDTMRGKKKGKKKKIQCNIEDMRKESMTQESKDSACHWSGGKVPTDGEKLCAICFFHMHSCE